MLARAALRIATVHALRGRTWAGDNVLDSAHGAIEEIAAEHARPVILVYTDDGHFTVPGRDLWSTEATDSRVDVGRQHLVVEVIITQRMRLIDDNGEPLRDSAGQPLLGATVPATTAGTELTCDVIERQIIAALTDPNSEWAEIWRQFATSIGDRLTQRGTLNRDGVRLAGRQIRLSVSLPREPLPGAVPSGRWLPFLAKLSATAELAPVRQIFDAAMAGATLTHWQQVIHDYGMTRPEARALGIVPPAGTEEQSPNYTIIGQVEAPPEP